MAEAFNSRSNQIVSDSAAQINAGDDLSTVDTDGSVLGKDGPANGRARRRREDDDGTEIYADDDIESLISQPVNGTSGKPIQPQEEEVDLPSHACA